MPDVLKKFGRYFLLDHIAQGGMAEIYRARLASVDGAGRLIVIKRIQAGYGANNEFLQMFKSEIKVTMGFNHPNIVQLYDFGEEQDQPYIAMEWVDGRNLRQYMTQFNELKQSLPVELAAYVVEQAAAGLHYAHEFKDKVSGAPLNIVHRDISPQNIIVSYEGNVKVIDFGIAKASNNIESTRAGVIKGKPSYLSPEQISGEALDGRCDIFALGIVLWELLCGRKLFQGESDLAVLKQIESCTSHVKPPSTINSKVPKELDYIVLKALAKQREKRYQTGEEMQRALHKFLYSFAPEFNPSDLSYFAKDLFKNEIVEDRKKIQRLNDKVEQLMATDIPEMPSVPKFTVGEKAYEDNTTTVVDPKRSQDLPLAPQAKNQKLELELDNAPQIKTAASVARQRAAAPTPQQVKAANPRTDHSSVRKLNAKQSGGLGRVLMLTAAAVLAVSVLGPEVGIRVPVLSDLLSSSKDDGLEKETRAQPRIPATIKSLANTRVSDVAQVVSGRTILLRLNVTPGGTGSTIYVNGKSVDPRQPAVVVNLDSPLELMAERHGYRPFKREFVLDSRQVSGLKEWLMDVPMEPLRFGFLSIHTTPTAEATIMIEGSPWVRKTPIENEKLPVGTYNIRLSNEVLGMEKTITVHIQEGRAISKDERLDLMRNPASN